MIGPTPDSQDIAALRALVGRAREALWTLRTHERNLDGSACWCPTENEPDIHTPWCEQARTLLHELPA